MSRRIQALEKQMTGYVLHLYGQRDYLAHSAPVHQREDLCHHAFISYVDDLLCRRCGVF